MSDEANSFSTARARLEDIVVQVRKKDTSLEKSLDLLEEGVRLANVCTELIDHADWSAGDAGAEGAGDVGDKSAEALVAGQPTGGSDDAVVALDADAAEAPAAVAAEEAPDDDVQEPHDGDA